MPNIALQPTIPPLAFAAAGPVVEPLGPLGLASLTTSGSCLGKQFPNFQSRAGADHSRNFANPALACLESGIITFTRG